VSPIIGDFIISCFASQINPIDDAQMGKALRIIATLVRPIGIARLLEGVPTH